jgi:hypothetical protein
MEVARRFRPADAEIEIELTSGAVGAFNLPALTGLSPSTLVDWAQVISAVLSILALVLALFAIWKIQT